MNLDNIKIDGTIKSKELSDGRIVTYMVPKQEHKESTMKELEMIKAFAKLEGVEVEYPMLDGLPYYRYSDEDGAHLVQYNPLLPNHLNCKAREKYNVSVVYMGFKSLSDCVSIANDFMVYLTNKEDAPKAVIECILKSKGLWVCQK